LFWKYLLQQIASTQEHRTMAAVLSPRFLGAAVLLGGVGVGLSGEVFSRERTLEGKAQLPRGPNTTSRCFDADGNGSYTAHECMGDEERILDLPASTDSVPFSWVMVNWNPAGHHQPYAKPHFDFHFYLSDRALVESIRPGRCGEMVDPSPALSSTGLMTVA
jgi:hypothetical protein